VKTSILAGLIALMVLLFSGLAFADGGIVPHPFESALAPDQKAAIFWNGSTERMILSTKITSEDFTGMAWVVPIQSNSMPEVKQADNDIFFDLADLFYTRPKYEGGIMSVPGLSGAASPPGVEVVQTQKVDIYDLTTLKATSAEALINWLNDNNFAFPENKKKVLDYYIQNGNYYFVANKINLLNKYPDAIVGENEKNCANAIFMYGSYEEMLSPSQVEEISKGKEDCNNANMQAVKALVELKQGIATPLEFIFTPEKPFYPMAISSINNGRTTANVYVFGKECFDDSSQVLEFKNAVQDSALAKEYGFNNAKCISLLRYSGPNAKLAKDSFFTEKPFKPEYAPDYVPPESPYLWVVEILIVLILALIFTVLPGLVIGILTADFSAKKKNHSLAVHLIGTFLMLCITAIPVLLIFGVGLTNFFQATLIAGLYLILQIGGFLAGYFAIKKKKLRIAAAGIAALAALILIIEAFLFLTA